MIYTFNSGYAFKILDHLYFHADKLLRHIGKTKIFMIMNIPAT